MAGVVEFNVVHDNGEDSFLIKYLGSKRKIIPTLLHHVPEGDTAIDAFSGTSRVTAALRQKGFRVHANDLSEYGRTIGSCYASGVVTPEVEELIEHLNGVSPRSGWFTNTYCVESRFFMPSNGEKVDGIREEIAKLPAGVLRDIALTSLMEAADRVDSTTGVQMAYLKQWAPRAYNPIRLRVPEIPDGPVGIATKLDAFDAVSSSGPVDFVYLDPPYNQHKYLGNYHIWETIAQQDSPDVYGVARKRVDTRDSKSPYNGVSSAAPALRELIRVSKEKSGCVITSFSSDGYICRGDLESMMGECETVSIDYARYVGCRIGIHNPDGKKVGEVGATRNQEFLFITRSRG